jgi:hypothetical protein
MSPFRVGSLLGLRCFDGPSITQRGFEEMAEMDPVRMLKIGAPGYPEVDF